jgi:hypothetical protein
VAGADQETGLLLVRKKKTKEVKKSNKKKRKVSEELNKKSKITVEHTLVRVSVSADAVVSVGAASCAAR